VALHCGPNQDPPRGCIIRGAARPGGASLCTRASPWEDGPASGSRLVCVPAGGEGGRTAQSRTRRSRRPTIPPMACVLRAALSVASPLTSAGELLALYQGSGVREAERSYEIEASESSQAEGVGEGGLSLPAASKALQRAWTWLSTARTNRGASLCSRGLP
jgi:hypothetical protein